MAYGACNCGAVVFEVEGTLDGIYMCHCSICRRFTGSGGIAVVLASKDAFRWLRGEDHIVKWSKPGADWHGWFCRTCGSPLPGENDPARVFIPAGLISKGGEGLTVQHHVFVDSRAPWDVIGDDGVQHPEGLKS
jgi:hypothetical protein